MKKAGVFLLVLILSCAFTDNAFAQAKKKKSNNLRVSRYKGSIKSFANKRYFTLGGMINTLNYFGDLAPKSQVASTDIKFTKPGFGVFSEYRFGPFISFGGYFTYGMLKGDDFKSADPADDLAKFRYIRNLQFRNQIFELALLVKVDILPNRGTYLSRPVINGYIFGGIAGLYHNPKGKVPETGVFGEPLENAGKWVDLQPLGTEGQNSEYYQDKFGVKPYSKFQYSVPIGVGATYRLTSNFDISFEIGYRILFFDHIDDVGGLYVDLGALDDPLAKAMSDRSREGIAVVSGEARDFEGTILPNTSEHTYTSEFDGQTYTVFGGYGHEHPDNTRGNSGDNDIYFVTSIKLTYLLGGTFQNAKFR